MGTDRRTFLSSMAAGLAGAALAQATGRAWAQGTKTKPGPQDVLLVIDVQNCFTPGGSLAVKDGDAIVPLINRLAGGFQHVVLTQDWHTPGHVSFASSHPGKKPFETTSLPYGTQVLWPDHCIQGTDGANLHKDLKIPHASLIIRKGHRQHMDSYSAFYEADGKTPTGLTGYLRDRGLTQVYLCGLATDFCVGWSAVDARKAGFGAASSRTPAAGSTSAGRWPRRGPTCRPRAAAARTSAEPGSHHRAGRLPWNRRADAETRSHVRCPRRAVRRTNTGTDASAGRPDERSRCGAAARAAAEVLGLRRVSDGSAA